MAPMDIGRDRMQVGAVFQFFFQSKSRYYNNLEALVSAMFAQIGAYDNLWCRCNANSALFFGCQGLRTTLVQRIQTIHFQCTSGRISGLGVSLQLVTFNGIFDIIDQEDFKAEKAGANYLVLTHFYADDSEDAC